MTIETRSRILRGNATYLLAASAGGIVMDLAGIFLGLGPESHVVGAAPYSGIGFLEAHGLAMILAILLWRAQPTRQWHLTAGCVHLLLGTANLAFWQIFITAHALWMGYLTTSLHWLFAVLQLCAAIAAEPSVDRNPIAPQGPLAAATRS